MAHRMNLVVQALFNHGGKVGGIAPIIVFLFSKLPKTTQLVRWLKSGI